MSPLHHLLQLRHGTIVGRDGKARPKGTIRAQACSLQAAGALVCSNGVCSLVGGTKVPPAKATREFEVSTSVAGRPVGPGKTIFNFQLGFFFLPRKIIALLECTCTNKIIKKKSMYRRLWLGGWRQLEASRRGRSTVDGCWCTMHTHREVGQDNQRATLMPCQSHVAHSAMLRWKISTTTTAANSPRRSCPDEGGRIKHEQGGSSPSSTGEGTCMPIVFRRASRLVWKGSEEGVSSLLCPAAPPPIWQPASLAAIFIRHTPRVLIGL